MNKEELIERINKLSLFEKRDVQVCNDDSGSDWTLQKQKAICKEKDTEAVAYVHPGYCLVQFRDVFLPILEGMDVEVDGYLADYGGFALLKVFPEMELLKDGDSKFGIVAMNSVDLSSSIIVKFCVLEGDVHFTIPPSVAGLKKYHTGNVKNIARNYLSLIGQVKAAWKTICQKFPEYTIVIDAEKTDEDQNVLELGSVMQSLKLGKRLSKKIRDAYDEATLENKEYTLWSLFVRIVEEVSSKNYKSGVHRERNIDKICNSVFTYATLLNI